MYEVTINRYKKDENGKRVYYRESHVYYESIKEADEAGITYHQDWKEAYVLQELRAGAHAITEEGHVVPILEVYYGSFPCVRTPNGSFNPTVKYGLTLTKFKNRRKYQSERPIDERDNANLARAAWHFARYGDPVKAYLFAYVSTNWLCKMSKAQVKSRSSIMCARIKFAKLYMAELSKYFIEAGVEPADLLKNIKDRVVDPKEKFDNVIKGSKLLLALHPDFREQVTPMVVGKGKGMAQLPEGNSAEDAEFVEIEEEEGEVVPGQHLNEKNNDENKKTKTVDAVVSGSLSSEPVLEKKA